MICFAYQRVAGRVNQRDGQAACFSVVPSAGAVLTSTSRASAIFRIRRSMRPFLATRPASCYRLRMRRRSAARLALGYVQ